jgi:hypothetical protein
MQQVKEYEEKYRSVLTKYHPERLTAGRSDLDVQVLTESPTLGGEELV